MHILVVSPSVDGVGLVEYFRTHPYFVALEEDPYYVTEDFE